MFTEKQIENILNSADVLDEKEFKKIKKEAKKNGKSIADYLVIKKIITEENLYQSAASYFKIPFSIIR